MKFGEPDLLRDADKEHLTEKEKREEQFDDLRVQFVDQAEAIYLAEHGGMPYGSDLEALMGKKREIQNARRKAEEQFNSWFKSMDQMEKLAGELGLPKDTSPREIIKTAGKKFKERSGKIAEVTKPRIVASETETKDPKIRIIEDKE